MVVLVAGSLAAQSLPVCDARAFGAKGDGATLDTAAVTAAIAACAKQGGGTVYFAPGRYVIGTVQLASHIHLLLESGAALVGSHDIGQYLDSPPFGFARHYGLDITGEGTVLGMLVAKDAEDISIDGGGEIDGQGDSFMTAASHGGNDYDERSVRNAEGFRAAMATTEYGPVEPDHRPGTMIVFFHCKNVRLHGVTLRGAPNWTMHLQDVDGASLSGFQILNNPKIPNNDGIDCMQCRHVRITDCNIAAGDDALAIVGSEQVNVSGCSLASRSAAIRLESTRLSTFSNLSMDTNRGIAVFASANVGAEERTEDVLFSNITMRTRLIPGDWWGKAEPIYIAVQPCGVGFPCGVRVRHVVFSNILAEAEGGALLWGGEGTAIEGVELNDVRLHMLVPEARWSGGVGGNLDLRWTAATPREGMVKSEIPAIYAKWVTGLRLRNVAVDWAAGVPGYFSDGVRVEDFQDLAVEGYSGRQAQVGSGAAVSLVRGTGVAITGSRASAGTRTFLRMEAVGERRVFANYDLGAAAVVMEPVGMRFEVQVGAGAARPKTGRGRAGGVR